MARSRFRSAREAMSQMRVRQRSAAMAGVARRRSSSMAKGASWAVSGMVRMARASSLPRKGKSRAVQVTLKTLWKTAMEKAEALSPRMAGAARSRMSQKTGRHTTVPMRLK